MKHLPRTIFLMALLLPLVALTVTSCRKFNIRDIDPGQAGRVRSLGPESQDMIGVADQMIRSLEEQKVFPQTDEPVIIGVLPLRNNTRYPGNLELLNTKLRTELGRNARGRYRFVSRDINPDVLAEREAKRDGLVDYDPNLRTLVPAGVDYFLVGSANGLATVSTRGQADYILYDFRLVDAETTLDIWQESYETKKEGKDDVIYR